MEKSSKNLISLFGEMPARGLPKPPPTPPCQESADLHVEKARLQDADAKSRHRIGTRRNGERGENNAKMQPLVNGLTFWRQVQNEDRYYPSSTYCIDKMCLLLASLASKNRVLYTEGRIYKKGAQASSQPSVDFATFNRQHLCEETKSATATHVE